MSNSVNPSNFNETMQGYTDYAMDFLFQRLQEHGYSGEQLEEIQGLLRNGFRWGKDEMTMEEARQYSRKFYIQK